MRKRSLFRWVGGTLFGVLLLLAWSVVPPEDVLARTLDQEEADIEHVVERGETLFGIAQQYNTTVEAIANANNIADPSRIAVGQRLIIPSGEGTTGRALTRYTVLPGDTLEVVARRVEAPVETIAKLNGLTSPVNLLAGGRLQVPAAPSGRLHLVDGDETAPGLALRYDQPLGEFLAVNDLSSSGALLPGQRVWVPGETLTATLPAPFVTLDVGPEPVLQGRTVALRVGLAPGAEVKGVFAEEVLQFALEGEFRYALFGVHALADPGSYPIALSATDASGDEVYVTRSLQVNEGPYGSEEILLPPDRDAMLDPVAVAAERARLAEIKTTFTPERYWEGLFQRPIDTELTSLFGTRRLYKSTSYQSYGYHEGNDFNGEVGSPVHAPASGVVVLAEPLFVRGNALIIDHGWGVYTGYWHLSQIDAQVGQQVVAGDAIALVGNTGLSTGAHLHWDFWVNGTNVDALQWTEQVFP